uniref:Uncharacterized protein n=1 Tax=Rhizophora mucronata TaxID=61149 RepID=A0A2P2PDU0_RHIMU
MAKNVVLTNLPFPLIYPMLSLSEIFKFLLN